MLKVNYAKLPTANLTVEDPISRLEQTLGALSPHGQTLALERVARSHAQVMEHHFGGLDSKGIRENLKIMKTANARPSDGASAEHSL